VTTIIHINRNVIQRNAKREAQGLPPEPVCRVQQGKVARYAMEVLIDGPSRMVYRPDQPLACGAKLWVETDSPVTLVDERVPDFS
jgi:hypothetical protein